MIDTRIHDQAIKIALMVAHPLTLRRSTMLDLFQGNAPMMDTVLYRLTAENWLYETDGNRFGIPDSRAEKLLM